MIDEIETRARQGNFPMNVCMEMRFMGESKSLLCPAVVGQHSPNKEVKTAYIEVLSLVRKDNRDWHDFTRAIATVNSLV